MKNGSTIHTAARKKITSAELIAMTIALGTPAKNTKNAISRVFTMSIVGPVMTSAITTVTGIGNVPENAVKNAATKNAIQTSPALRNARTSMRKGHSALKIVSGSAKMIVRRNVR